MTPDMLSTIARRRVEQAAGAAQDRWLAAHGLTGESTATKAGSGSPEDQFLAACRKIAARGRLLEVGLAAGRDSNWLLHPERGLRMCELLVVATRLATSESPLDWAALRARIDAEQLAGPVALTLNLICKTLDIPLGAVALDRLELYAWKPRPGSWPLRKLSGKQRVPGYPERWLLRERKSKIHAAH